MSFREWLKVYLKGAAMGAADAVPGVSGGTIALITGIYERLIDALSAPDAEKAVELLELLRTRDLRGITDLMKEMDVLFLLILVSGIGSSVLLVLNLMHILLENFAVPTYGFFFGLIAASAVVLYSEVDLSTTYRKIAAVAGFLITFFISDIGATSLGHSPLILFLSGAVAISAMILPGISGSLILVILGQYEHMSSLISGLTGDFLKLLHGGNLIEFLENAFPAIIFVSGAVVGVFTVVNAVKMALDRHQQATMAFLVSLMVGALRSPLIQANKALSGNMIFLEVLPGFAAAAVVGAAAVLILDRKTVDI